jgi:hypothetical protein
MYSLRLLIWPCDLDLWLKSFVADRFVDDFNHMTFHSVWNQYAPILIGHLDRRARGSHFHFGYLNGRLAFGTPNSLARFLTSNRKLGVALRTRDYDSGIHRAVISFGSNAGACHAFSSPRRSSNCPGLTVPTTLPNPPGTCHPSPQYTRTSSGKSSHRELTPEVQTVLHHLRQIHDFCPVVSLPGHVNLNDRDRSSVLT